MAESKKFKDGWKVRIGKSWRKATQVFCPCCRQFRYVETRKLCTRKTYKNDLKLFCIDCYRTKINPFKNKRK